MGFGTLCQETRARAMEQDDPEIRVSALKSYVKIPSLLRLRPVVRRNQYYLVTLTAQELVQDGVRPEHAIRCSRNRFERYVHRSAKVPPNAAHFLVYVFTKSGIATIFHFHYDDQRLDAYSAYRRAARARVISTRRISPAPGYYPALKKCLTKHLTKAYLPGYYVLCMTYDEAVAFKQEPIKFFPVSRDHFFKLANTHPNHAELSTKARYSLFYATYLWNRGSQKNMIQIE